MMSRFGYACSKFMLLTAPLMAALMIAAVAANFVQVKALFAPEVIKPKFDKLNPVTGFKNIFFSSKTYIEMVKNLLKFVVVFWVLYSAIKGGLRRHRPDCRDAAGPNRQAGGPSDVEHFAEGWRGFRHSRRSRLSDPEEDVHEENDDEQGRHQAGIQGAGRRSACQAPAQAPVRADDARERCPQCPTGHGYRRQPDAPRDRVAVRREATMQAPQVTAKGQDSMALEIIDIAKKNQVPVVRNIGLAHSLFDLEIGHDIPEDLYEAVAEVLNFVYQLDAAANN